MSSGEADISTALYALRDAQAERSLRTLNVITPAPRTIRDLSALAAECLQASVPGFVTDAASAGSFIASFPLAPQLLTQPHLTVDLTLSAMASERPFGLSWGSLKKLAASGHVYLNLRDFDSDALQELKGHRQHARRLGELLQDVPNTIYFGSAVRGAVLDWATAQSTGQRQTSHLAFVAAAREDLGPAARALNEMPDDAPAVERARFRGERPSEEATYWHVAYLEATALFLPDWVKRTLHDAYARAADTKSGEDFASLARLHRLAHLSFTAPITAAFGTTYNMTADEYADSLELFFEPAPELPVAVRREGIEAFLWYLFGIQQHDEHYTVPTVDSGFVAASQQEFSDAQIEALIEVLAKRQPQVAEVQRLLGSLQADSAQIAGPSAEDLLERYRAVVAKSVAELVRAEARWRQVFRVGSLAAAGTLALSLPWLALPFLIEGLSGRVSASLAEAVVTALRLSSSEDRALYRVHKVLKSTR